MKVYLISLAFSSITILLMALVLITNYFEYLEARQTVVTILEASSITAIVLSILSYEWKWARVGGVVSFTVFIVTFLFF